MKTMSRLEIPLIGTALGGGFYTGEMIAHNLNFSLVTIGKEGEFCDAGGKSGEDVPGAHSFVNGYDNTVALALAGNKTAQKILEMRIGGQDDWAWPARNQQELQYRNLKPTTRKNYCSYLDGYNPDSVPAGRLYTPDFPLQTIAEAFREGGAEAFRDAAYWSSTQSSAGSAFFQSFDFGIQHYYGYEGLELWLRPVRMIQIID